MMLFNIMWYEFCKFIDVISLKTIVQALSIDYAQTEPMSNVNHELDPSESRYSKGVANCDIKRQDPSIAIWAEVKSI